MPHPTAGYRTKDGKRVPGVTTIIGRFKDSGGLLHWAFQQGQACERGEIGSLYDKRDESGESGTLAHNMIEAYIKGQTFEPPKVSEEILRQATLGYENYREWERNNSIVITETEMELVSEEFRYGGCPDAIGTANGKVFLLDWKTSNSVYPDYLCQLGAYGQLLEECRGVKVDGYHLCRFSKENADFSHHYFADLSDGWELFKLYREAYELDKKLKKRV